MASTNSSTPSNNNKNNTGGAAETAEAAAAKLVQKRYEGLVMVRTKAVKGKGAWYWAHLEPILVHSPDSGLPKAVKLRCSLCDAVFSASNPSRTASEHLKRGTCPNFNSSGGGNPISAVKRSLLPAPPPPPPPPLALSGGKDDLAPLAMLEDSVKRLKTPKTSPGPALTRPQADSALDLLSDWLYHSCGSVSFSSLDHPKFRAFLHQVGVPPVSARDLAGARLDARFDEARAESDARIRDAMFFQLASDGWKTQTQTQTPRLVNLAVNLPNGTSVYRRAVFVSGRVPSRYAEDVMAETVAGINAERCAGIVADGFKSKALRRLEAQNQWMVNLCCQFQGLLSLLKDLFRGLPLFSAVYDQCWKIASAVNEFTTLRRAFQGQGEAASSSSVASASSSSSLLLLRLPLREDKDRLEPALALLDDVLSSARPIHLAFRDSTPDHPSAREASDIVADPAFWSRLEAAHALAKLVSEAAASLESDRPLVGQCLPLWDDVRARVKDWSAKFNSAAEEEVDRIVERRFRKNYHPAWAAALILDPLYLVRDATGKYLPPFKRLTAEQDKDVDRLITRLVSREEAHIALMELMKWRTEGLDPVYARAVQMKELDPATGKMRLANPQSSRLVWETYLTGFRSLGRVAVRLIFLRATARGFRCAAPLLRWASRGGAHRAQKIVFVAAHARLQRSNDHHGDDDDDANIMALPPNNNNGEDDVLNDVLLIDQS